MTVLKIKNRPGNSHFNSFVDDFFNQFSSIDKQPLVKHPVPVNIYETENSFRIELIAPGVNKEDIKIAVEDNIVTVSFEKKSENEEKTEKTIRSEYELKSFSRSFTIDETVDAEQISAQYVNGVLALNFPKKVVVKRTKQIDVA